MSSSGFLSYFFAIPDTANAIASFSFSNLLLRQQQVLSRHCLLNLKREHVLDYQSIIENLKHQEGDKKLIAEEMEKRQQQLFGV